MKGDLDPLDLDSLSISSLSKGLLLTSICQLENELGLLGDGDLGLPRKLDIQHGNTAARIDHKSFTLDLVEAPRYDHCMAELATCNNWVDLLAVEAAFIIYHLDSALGLGFECSTMASYQLQRDLQLLEELHNLRVNRALAVVPFRSFLDLLRSLRAPAMSVSSAILRLALAI